MSHPIHRVTHFQIIDPTGSHCVLNDGTEQRIFQAGESTLSGPLQDLQTFNAVSLDEEAGTLLWPNGADFDPAALHDWPSVRDDVTRMARAWAGNMRGHRAR